MLDMHTRKNDFHLDSIQMETLAFLVSKGILDEHERAVPPATPIKVVKNGVTFQQKCHNGLPYDIAISWLQKAIRRGLKNQALYCAYHIASLGKIFRSHLLNRLITILSEDIGPAEPGLPVEIEYLYDLAKQLEKEGCLDKVHRAIIQMVSLLSDSRKSRIADWVIHDNDRNGPVDEPTLDVLESLEAMAAWALYYAKRRLHDDNWIDISYIHDGSPYRTTKKLSLYHVWNIVLLATEDTDAYDDVAALLRLFMVRGPEYGLLHFIHAICLVWISNPESMPKLPDVLPTWESLASLDFAVMNDAVDMHTRHGRTLLGRGYADFLYYGSKLENWTPFPTEVDLIEKFKSHLELPAIENSEPREYQQQIVNKAVSHLRELRTGWLLMACGTGKTKTSYWVMKNLIDLEIAKGKNTLVIVVTPFLQILRQFYQCWSAMNRLHKLKSITGILASCADVYTKDEYSNYMYLTNDTVAEFMGYPDTVKYIFTTYSSLPKLLHTDIKPTLVVYDEAHHAKLTKVFNIGMELFLTATPHISYGSFGGVIANYNLRDAINDGFLTKYMIGVIQDSSDIDSLAYVLTKAKKVIVYCKTNELALNYYNDWITSGGNPDCTFYVNCKTSGSERLRIFKGYRTAVRAVIFNCAILGEGVDFTDCDAILIHSGYKSPTRVVQAMGRPLRIKPGKDLAKIFIIDDGAVDMRLDAMATYDPEVYDQIEYIY